ncbi:MAG: hypothetical protein KDE04_09145, partial [Anaerolineales bacterium]|nr:hypothetical protein [Anaerolineales bacterium]
MPALPFWLVPIGDAYQISFDNTFTYAHCQATNTATSLLFSYPERDLPNRVWEDRLTIYYLEAGEWQPVSNLSVNPELNLVSGAYVTNTVYVLGMSNEIELQRGWNLVGYPHRRPISVTTLIEPVVADIGAIIGYANRATGFQIYCPHTATGNTPPHRPNAGAGGSASSPSATRAIPKCRHGANDLTELQYGYGYWVYAINDTTLRLPVDLINDPGNQPEAASVAQVMPAFLDGQLTSAEEPSWAGASLVAWIDGHRCGETTV